MDNYITLKGARTHNLKNINLKIPRGKITAIVGVSGAGKSSLAFDTLYAEGYLSYIESVSPYVRQFLDKINKPPVDEIKGLSPAIAFRQKKQTKNPRSIVASAVDIYDYLRIVYAKISQFVCPGCKTEITCYSLDEIVSDLLENEKGKVQICFSYKGDIAPLIKQGYYFYISEGARKRIGKDQRNVAVDVLIDAVEIDRRNKSRLFEAVERSLALGRGTAQVNIKNEIRFFPSQLFCTTCHRAFEPPDESLFSFNNPKGACPGCKGLGKGLGLGVCPSCGGNRLANHALNFLFMGQTITQILSMTVQEAGVFFKRLDLNKYRSKISLQVFADIDERLVFLQQTGLHYIQLNRPTSTLSRSEYSRINMAPIWGSDLSDSLVIVDQPSAGLHHGEFPVIKGVLDKLKSRNNTVVMVEHNLSFIAYSDYIVELGPGAGENGGELLFMGERDLFLDTSKGKLTKTQSAFTKKHPARRMPGTGQDWLAFKDARSHNLKGFDFKIPLHAFTAVTGPSGAGKTTLLHLEIYKRWARVQSRHGSAPFLKQAVYVDSGLSGFHSGTILATFFNFFTALRELFAGLKESRVNGYTPGHFSFNSPLGACPECRGRGFAKVNMQFLPSLQLVCDYCAGGRYNQDILKVFHQGRNIHQLLELSILELLDIYHEDLKEREKNILTVIIENGMGYLRLGQPLTTLSSGEVHRIKLIKYLDQRKQNTLFLIDELSSGLHTYDVELVKQMINRLIESNNTVVVTDNHTDILDSAQHLLQLGPGGGSEGGQLIFQGEPNGSVYY